MQGSREQIQNYRIHCQKAYAEIIKIINTNMKEKAIALDKDKNTTPSIQNKQNMKPC